MMRSSMRRGAYWQRLALPILLAAAVHGEPLLAADAPSGWVKQTLAMELVGARSELGNTPDRGQFGTGQVIDGIRDGAFRSGPEADTSAAVGVRLDRYVSERLLVGLMAHWHFPVDWDVAARTPRIQTITNTFTNVERVVVLARVGHRWPLGPRWELQAALAAGAAQLHLDTVYTERAVPGIRAEQRSTRQRRQVETAWGLELGVRRSLGRQLALGLSYRYLNSGDLSVRARPGASATISSTLHDHLFAISLDWQRR